MKMQTLFLSKSSGDGFASAADMELQPLSILVISFFALVALYAVLATCIFIKRNWIRGERPEDTHVCKSHGMSYYSVKAMPTVTFTSVSGDNCTSATCTICLEDYYTGEKLRILPCHHKFHATCVDTWLTSWRTFCPVCKRDARLSTDEPPLSQLTPLLSSTSISSVRLSYASLFSPSSQSPMVSDTQSSYNTPQNLYYALWLASQ